MPSTGSEIFNASNVRSNGGDSRFRPQIAQKRMMRGAEKRARWKIFFEMAEHEYFPQKVNNFQERSNDDVGLARVSATTPFPLFPLEI